MRNSSISTPTKQTSLSIYSDAVLKHLPLFIILVVGTIADQATSLISPLYLKKLFNTLTIGNPSPTIVHGLIITIGIILILSLADWALTRVQNFTVQIIESRIMAELYATTFTYLMDHSYHFFSSQFTGTLTRRVSKFVSAFETLFDSVMLQFFPTALFVVGAVVILFIRNHTLGLFLLVWVVLFVAFQIWVAKLRQPVRAARAKEDSKVVGMLSDAVSNHITVTLFAGNTFEQKNFSDAVQQWRKAVSNSWTADELIWAALALFFVVLNVGMLYGAVQFWERGLLTVGDFVLIQAYLLSTFQQLIGINRNLRRFYDGHADALEMVDILNTPHEIQDAAGAKELSISNGAIDFSAITFYFAEANPVLTDFTLSIPGKQKVALVGPSGAGKSTITKLLLRLYNVKVGAIVIDDQDIAAVTQKSLRELISFVPQEPILFHRSLMENIRYGRLQATDEEVYEAARQAHCHEFITAFPEGYNTFVGERGVKLSGGERQRVAIARAILKNAPILVLDEATSSLDSESESLIQQALEVLMQNKTVIVIAHRLSTIMKMDRIVVLQNGAIAAQGTHSELLEQGGLYHKLWSIQAGGFIVDEDEQETIQESEVDEA
jgi:ATP-binding cassette subfamily B protein